MTLLHTTELDEYVRATDPRITYWPIVDQDLFGARYGATITPRTPTETTVLLQGTIVANEELGRLTQRWRLELIEDDTVIINRLTSPQTQQVVAFSVQDGLSSLIELERAGPSVRISRPDLGINNVWDIVAHARPARELADIVQQLQAGIDQSALFGINPPEPYLTFSQLWARNTQLAYRLGGLLLALAYRTRELVPGAG